MRHWAMESPTDWPTEFPDSSCTISEILGRVLLVLSGWQRGGGTGPVSDSGDPGAQRSSGVHSGGRSLPQTKSRPPTLYGKIREGRTSFMPSGNSGSIGGRLVISKGMSESIFGIFSPSDRTSACLRAPFGLILWMISGWRWNGPIRRFPHLCRPY